MPALPFKLNQDRRHHIPKQKHKVTNWARVRRRPAPARQPDGVVHRGGDRGVGGRATHDPGRAALATRALAILTALTLRAVFRLAAPPDRGADRLRHRPARPGPRACRTTPPSAAGPRRWRCRGRGRMGPQRRRAHAPAGGQHGPEALRRGRVAGREARHQHAPVLAKAAPRHGCRHRPDRRLGADHQGCR